MKYRVYGTTQVHITMTVEAENEDEAIEIACQEYGGLTGYAGNGGSGKLIGTRESNVMLSPGDDTDFTDAEPA